MRPSLAIYPDANHTKKYWNRPSIHQVMMSAVLWNVVGGGGGGVHARNLKRVL